MLISNEIPRLSDASGALPKRFIVLPLEKSFLGHEDFQLTKKLLEELPGIFNWAIEGWRRLHERGHFVQPACGHQAIRDLEDLSSPMGAFVRDKCIVGPEQSVPIPNLFSAWKDWCHDQGRDHPGSAQTFGRDLRAVMPSIRVAKPINQYSQQQVRTYEGIGLRT